MAKIGAPQTQKALIGTFELRIGPMNKAGRLAAEHSVGIIDQVKLDVQMDSVDLMAGFPQKPVDTAITKFVTGFTATLREGSLRNLNVLLGNGLQDTNVEGPDVSGIVNTSVALVAGATALTMDISFAGTLAIGDTVVIYETTNPSNMSVSKVATFTAKSGVTPASLTLESTRALVSIAGKPAFAQNASVKLYKAPTISGGNISSAPQYFSAQLIRLDRTTGRPVGFNFWKTSIATGAAISAAVTEFASTDMQLKAMEPLDSEYAAGGALVHLASIIPSNRVFQIFDAADSVNGAITAPIVIVSNPLFDINGVALNDINGIPLTSL
jgi:hypothetical protein